MKTLLFLNGPEGWQTGIEDGFINLQAGGEISQLKWFYFEDYAKKFSESKSILKMIELANEFLPELIVFFHISKFPINKKCLQDIKDIQSRPLIVYDEGDMYGGWAKPMTKNMKLIINFSDVVSIRGFGKWYNKVNSLNKNIIYTPNHADIARFDAEPHILKTRQYDILFIGNKLKSRIWGNLKRLSGANGRDNFVKNIGLNFPKEFVLFGNGWNGYIGARGPVPFQQQLSKFKDSWIILSYEHYPEIPYFFSNRLPIALLAGSIIVCNYHKGYEHIFKNCDFIYFFNSNSEAVDIIKYILSLDNEQLIERSIRSREFALKYYTPNVIWTNFFNNVKGYSLK